MNSPANTPATAEAGAAAEFLSQAGVPEGGRAGLPAAAGRVRQAAADVAAAAVFLASDAAEFFTGIEFPVDGGRTI